MEIDTDELEEFVRNLEEAYLDESFIQTYTQTRRFDPDRDENKEFVQIGKRSNLPKRYFRDENVTHIILGDDFARHIARGEERFILREIAEQANDGKIGQIETPRFDVDTIVDGFGKVYNPDFLFIPREVNFKEIIMDLDSEGLLNQGNLSVSVGGPEVEIRMIPDNLEVSGGFLYNGESVDVVQKLYGDVDRPEEADYYPDRDWCREDDPLMVYFGERFKDNPEEFEFWFRTVISKPRLKHGGVCHFDLSERT